MDEKNKKYGEDSFWDLSSVMPRGNAVASSTKSTHTVSVEISPKVVVDNSPAANENGKIIKRYIDPLHDENKKIRKESFETQETYTLDDSLIHSVTLKKRKSTYDLYSDFVRSAIELSRKIGSECEYVSFYSYVPQYDQLSQNQLQYYLWWRECFNRDEFIKTDLSYVLLYVYELINLGDLSDCAVSQRKLAKIWNIYHEEFPTIASKLAIWICDFSLIHRLPPPDNIKRRVTKHVSSLKEFFIRIPSGDLDVCASSLLKYGTEYDYKTSKFATEKNIDLFDKHIRGALITAIRFFSKDGKILSSLSSEDSRLIRNSFEGALCTSKWRYEIDVRYCSFSRSNEFRFIMGDIVKYSENKLRAFLGVKSKLSVYSIGAELQHELDSYFSLALSNERPRIERKEEKHEYDRLYDQPKRSFSLENAKRIEESSWETTNDLISAFEDEDIAPQETITVTEEIINIAMPEENISESDLGSALGDLLEFALAVKRCDTAGVEEICKTKNQLPEALVDAVNEIAVDIIGDIFIEDAEDGFTIVDSYFDLI